MIAAVTIIDGDKNPDAAVVGGDRSRMETARDMTAAALLYLYTIIRII